MKIKIKNGVNMIKAEKNIIRRKVQTENLKKRWIFIKIANKSLKNLWYKWYF